MQRECTADLGSQDAGKRVLGGLKGEAVLENPGGVDNTEHRWKRQGVENVQKFLRRIWSGNVKCHGVDCRCQVSQAP